jgi:DDE superfamily endonuclease
VWQRRVEIDRISSAQLLVFLGDPDREGARNPNRGPHLSRDSNELFIRSFPGIVKTFAVCSDAAMSPPSARLRIVPGAIVTDRLASYAAANAVVMPTVIHVRGWRQNNRVENSHQPVRRRERARQRFKSRRHAARFCAVFGTVWNQFRPGRHALSARNYARFISLVG